MKKLYFILLLFLLSCKNQNKDYNTLILGNWQYFVEKQTNSEEEEESPLSFTKNSFSSNVVKNSWYLPEK